jgi:hypothetical protein
MKSRMRRTVQANDRPYKQPTGRPITHPTSPLGPVLDGDLKGDGCPMDAVSAIAHRKGCDARKDADMRDTALIVAPPGPLRDGLHALVGSMPQIGTVRVVSDVEGALVCDLEIGPRLVVLDGNLGPDRAWHLVRRAKRKWPRARTIALVATVRQQQEAEAAGADAVLLQGLPAGRLVAAIVRLLPQPCLQ